VPNEIEELKADWLQVKEVPSWFFFVRLTSEGSIKRQRVKECLQQKKAQALAGLRSFRSEEEKLSV
jgi:hypothetical protein